MDQPDPLVPAEWLMANLDAPDVRVVEATWFPPWTPKAGQGKAEYQAGHIPGAVFFDIDEIRDETSDLPHMLPDSIKFSSRVRKLGIGDGNRVVVYDRNGFFASARVWWMLRVMGHRDVRVLDGGLAAWTEAGGALEDMPPVAVERHFTPRIRADLVKDAGQVDALSKSGAAQILDARSPGRFSGEEPEPRKDLPSGRIPGSLNVPASTLIGDDGRLKRAGELENLLDASRQTVCTCGSGVSAAIIALALARLGNHDAAVYDGSWSDWASDPARAIETGPA